MCADKVHYIHELLACTLIPLDKNSGLRPIGVGEILRRIISKSVMSVIRGSITESVGPLQTCAGQESGIEATIHAMRGVFERDSAEGFLIVDAANDSVNRATFHNIKYVQLAVFVEN